MKNTKKIVAGVLSLAMLSGIAAGCTKYESGSEKVYSYDEAIKELKAFNDQIQTAARYLQERSGVGYARRYQNLPSDRGRKRLYQYRNCSRHRIQL